MVGLLGACGGGDAEPSATSTAISRLETSSTTAKARTVRIMPLGDSLTQGDDPTKPTTSPQSYRGYLQTSLTEAGYTVDFVGSQQLVPIAGSDPDHEGHGGYTIGPDASVLCGGCPPANLDSGLDGWLAQAKPDYVLLLAGVNDLLPDANAATGLSRVGVPAEADDKLKALVERIRAQAPDAVVLVGSYPPTSYLVDPALANLAPFTALNKMAATLGDGRDEQVHYVPIFETLEDSWSDADVLTEVFDELHPSATGAKRIAGVWFEVLEPLLAAEVGTPTTSG